MRSKEEYQKYRTKADYVFSDICHTMATYEMSPSDGIHALCEFLCSTAIEKGRSKELLLKQISDIYDHFKRNKN